MRLALHFATLVITAFVFLVGSACVSFAQGTGTISLRCPKGATNIRILERVLAAQVKASLDGSVYGDIRVRVGLRLVGAEKAARSYSFDEFLGGLTLTQQGLTTTIEGDYSYNETCSYRYVAKVQVIARDIASGAVLKSSTDSLMTVTSGGDFQVKKFSPPPTPTPGPIPTQDPTDPGSDEGGDNEEPDSGDDEET